MAMTLVYRGISRQKIEILLSFDVVEVHPFPSFENHRQGVVIVRAVAVFKFDGFLCFRVFFRRVHLRGYYRVQLPIIVLCKGLVKSGIYQMTAPVLGIDKGVGRNSDTLISASKWFPANWRISDLPHHELHRDGFSLIARGAENVYSLFEVANIYGCQGMTTGKIPPGNLPAHHIDYGVISRLLELCLHGDCT